MVERSSHAVQEGDSPTPGGAPGCLASVNAIAIAGALVVAVAGGALAGRCSAPAPPPPPAAITVVRPTPNVIKSVRDLSRLESAEMHVERVIDLTEKQQRFFGLLETEDAILLVAAGDVVAGVDLSKLSDDDVKVDPEKKTARIRMPKAEILSARLDNERTYVHSRTTDALAKRQKNLETRARQRAEASIREAAERSNLLKRAERNAARTIESLVRSLGYDDVKVDFDGGTAPAPSAKTN